MIVIFIMAFAFVALFGVCSIHSVQYRS